MSLRDGRPAASRRPIRPAANVQGIPDRVRRARRYVARVLPDAYPVPAHRRSGRRRQDAVQTLQCQTPAPVPVARPPRTGQHDRRRPRQQAVYHGRRSGQHVPLRFAS